MRGCATFGLAHSDTPGGGGGHYCDRCGDMDADHRARDCATPKTASPRDGKTSAAGTSPSGPAPDVYGAAYAAEQAALDAALKAKRAAAAKVVASEADALRANRAAAAAPATRPAPRGVTRTAAAIRSDAAAKVAAEKLKAEAVKTLGPNASQYAIDNFQPKGTASVCPRCSRAFGVTRWRNHCCACGACVCFDCSKGMEIIVIGHAPATVCDDCPGPVASKVLETLGTLFAGLVVVTAVVSVLRGDFLNAISAIIFAFAVFYYTPRLVALFTMGGTALHIANGERRAV